MRRCSPTKMSTSCSILSAPRTSRNRCGPGFSTISRPSSRGATTLPSTPTCASNTSLPSSCALITTDGICFLHLFVKADALILHCHGAVAGAGEDLLARFDELALAPQGLDREMPLRALHSAIGRGVRCAGSQPRDDGLLGRARPGACDPPPREPRGRAAPGRARAAPRSRRGR